MFSKINSFSTRGIDGYRITVEVDVSNGLPSFVMVGYLAEEVREAQERVRTALRNAGFCLPPKRITVNLSPAGVRKEGTGCDLAIAAGILRCLWEQGEKAKIRKTDETCPEMDGVEDEENNSAPNWDQWAFIGELGLDGSIKPLTGVLSMVYEARARQEKRFADESISYNSQMTRRQIEKYCRLSGEDVVFLEKVERQQGISARGHGKILKVARTLADLDGQAEIGRTQLAEAIGFRSFEKKYWGSL